VRKAEAEAEIKRLAAEARAKVAELEAGEQARLDELARNREKDQLSWESERAQLLARRKDEERHREAEARLHGVEAELKESAEAATARRIKKQEDQAAAEAEEKAAEARRQAAEADLKAGQARVNKAKAEADAKALERKAADDAAAAAAAWLKASEEDLKAAELEAEARLTPVEREARKIADLIRTEGLKAVTVSRIEKDFGVSLGTASGRRKRAIQILQENGELPAEVA
jgi:hypothetical protein